VQFIKKTGTDVNVQHVPKMTNKETQNIGRLIMNGFGGKCAIWRWEAKAAISRLADSSSGVLNLHIFGRKRMFGKLSWETNPRHWLKIVSTWKRQCNVIVVDLKYFFRFPKLLNSLLRRIRYW
jgi:hypothetical protein